MNDLHRIARHQRRADPAEAAMIAVLSLSGEDASRLATMLAEHYGNRPWVDARALSIIPRKEAA